MFSQGPAEAIKEVQRFRRLACNIQYRVPVNCHEAGSRAGLLEKNRELALLTEICASPPAGCSCSQSLHALSASSLQSSDEFWGIFGP